MKTLMKQKTVALLLAALMTAAAFAGCSQPAAEDGGQSGDPAGTADNGAAAEEVVVEEEPDPFELLPAKDCAGRDYVMLARALNVKDQWVEGITGEAFNDAVYERNTIVDEKYNVNVTAVEINGEWGDRTTFLTSVRSSVQAGDGAYDLIEGYAATIGDGFADHLYYNLNEVPNLQLDQGWWSSIIRNELTINGRLFAITGDIAVSVWKNMQVYFFNKDVVKEYGLEYPYADVLEGKWTIDRYLGILEGTAIDVDGDGKMGDADRFGALYFDPLSLMNMHNAFGIHQIARDGEGNVTLDLFNEKMVYTAELLVNMGYNNPDIFFVQKDDVGNTQAPTRQKFMEGLGLFYASTLSDAEIMRDMDSDFGILPPPKYDETQEMYYTTSRDGRSMFVIPVDVKDVDFAGMITEAICVAGNRKVIPVYYDTVLKTKTARDEESGQMLDIIRDGLVLDFAAEYAPQTDSAGFILRTCLNGKSELASTYNTKIKAWNKLFERFLEPYYD